ncbi:MAG: sigma-70 family RNA polymerase sigma factor [Solirubrobacteraceae bacterium]
MASEQMPVPSEGVLGSDELATRWRRDGDEHARDELFRRFLPLARKLAGRYSNPYEPLEDLVQVASLGLLGAVDRFDPDRGVHFSAFAVPTILGELKRYFRNTGWSAHVPRSAQELALRVDRASREITGRTGRSPRVPELAGYLEIPVDDVLTGLDAGTAHYSVSLDAPASSSDVEEPQTLAESLGDDDDRYELIETRLSVSAAMTRLPYRERQALSLRIEQGLKQVEIAEEMDCSQMQVSRLLRSAAARLHELTDPPV